MDLRGKIDHSNSNCNFLVIWVGILILCAFVCLIRICCFKVKDIKFSIFQEEQLSDHQILNYFAKKLHASLQSLYRAYIRYRYNTNARSTSNDYDTFA